MAPLALTLMIVVLPAPSASSTDGDPEASVAADDVRDAIIGTGGLVLPRAVADDTRREVAGCRGCAWRLTSPCVEGPLGNAFDGQAACLSVTRGCQVGSLRRTWFRPADEGWRDLGLLCLESDPVTVESVGDRVREGLLHRLPDLSVSRLPSEGIVTGLPTVFSSGQPGGTQRFAWRILGRQVAVAVSATWSWRFPGSPSFTTEDPGGLHPAGRIRHAFRRSGMVPVTCASRWTGEFTVDGLGPFPIPGAVTQESSTDVPVGEGRALLTP